MTDECGSPLTREERELLTYFRGLPLQQQMDILGSTEASFNFFERMKQLAARKVEREASEEDDSPWN